MMVNVNNTLFYARIVFFPIFKLVEKGNPNGVRAESNVATFNRLFVP
jgi:hypothetical protein